MPCDEDKNKHTNMNYSYKRNRLKLRASSSAPPEYMHGPKAESENFADETELISVPSKSANDTDTKRNWSHDCSIRINPKNHIQDHQVVPHPPSLPPPLSEMHLNLKTHSGILSPEVAYLRDFHLEAAATSHFSRERNSSFESNEDPINVSNRPANKRHRATKGSVSISREIVPDADTAIEKEKLSGSSVPLKKKKNGDIRSFFQPYNTIQPSQVCSFEDSREHLCAGATKSTQDDQCDRSTAATGDKTEMTESAVPIDIYMRGETTFQTGLEFFLCLTDIEQA